MEQVEEVYLDWVTAYGDTKMLSKKLHDSSYSQSSCSFQSEYTKEVKPFDVSQGGGEESLRDTLCMIKESLAVQRRKQITPG